MGATDAGVAGSAGTAATAPPHKEAHQTRTAPRARTILLLIGAFSLADG
jgi:hypothetical protein